MRLRRPDISGAQTTSLVYAEVGRFSKVSTAADALSRAPRSHLATAQPTTLRGAHVPHPHQ